MASVLFPVFLPLYIRLNGICPLAFYQTTVMNKAPGYLGGKLLNRMNVILASSSYIKEQLLKSGSRRIYFLPPCIDAKKILCAQPANKTKKYKIGFLNSVNRIKGPDIAAAAFASHNHPECEYVIAGHGELKSALMEKYGRVPGFRFLDYLQDPIPELKSFDVIVLPFRTSVGILGISQTVLECMQAGVAVVGTRQSVIASVITHNKSGILIDTMDEIPKAIDLLIQNPALKAELIANARKTVQACDVEVIVEKLLGCLRSCK